MTKSTRREFLKQGATAAAGIYGLSNLIGAANAAPKAASNGKSRIVITQRPGLMANSEGHVDAKAISAALADGMKALTGTTSSEGAWKSLFKPTDVVGIKINCLFGKNASTRPEVVMAVAAGLQSAGVKPGNIIIWDRTNHDLIKAGYAPSKEPGKIQCYGTDGDYDAESTQQGSFDGRLSRILSTKITALVNVPILKDHSMAGVTLAMKNHYGSVHNPGALHGGHCDPFCADLNAVPAIRQKTRLIVCDLIKPLCNGGPGVNPEYLWDYKALMLGIDPVALDTLGWQIIEERRKEMGLPTLEKAGRPFKTAASAAARGIGTNDPARMDVVRLS